MEFIATKHRRKCNRKHFMNSVERFDHIKFEFKSEKLNKALYNKRKKRKFVNRMNASTFWKNYKAADEWQKRHNVTWWKTRCFALEHENHVLKINIKNLIAGKSWKNNLTKIYPNTQCNIKNTEYNENESTLSENIEFHLNEEMIYFLTQSIKHKIELKNKKEITDVTGNVFGQVKEEGFDWINKKNEDAKLLYGKASSRVLAMETALEATIERHIDKTKPQYWPNIPLKL